MTPDTDRSHGRKTVRSFVSRLLVVLPVAFVAAALPVVRPETKPEIKHWSLEASGGVVKAPAEFGLVGISVPDGTPASTRVLVRASDDGRRWGRFVPLEFEADVGPDAGSAEGGSHTSMPVWTGRKRFVDVRFPDGRPAGAKVHVIDPGPDPSTPLPSAAASPSQPPIVSRAAWGADESIRRGKPSYAEPIKMAIVHHTATADSYSASQSDDIVRSIYAYHVRTNGWDDIGYNFLVDRYGTVFEGRAGGINRTVIGAHAQGFNRHSAGISIIGNFASAKPPEVAMQALKRITSWRLDQGVVDPAGTVTYTSGGSNKFPAGKRVTLRTVSGHRDVGQTACPGNPLYGALPWLREVARAEGAPKLLGVRLSRGSITPNSDGVADGLRMVGTLTASTSWRTEIIDQSGRVVYAKTGTGTSLNVPWYGKTSSGAIASHGKYRFKVTGRGLRTYEFGFNVYRWPNGTIMLTSRGKRFILEANKLRLLSGWDARATRYASTEYVSVPSSVKYYYGAGPMIGFRDGTLIKLDGKVYVISSGKRRPTTTSVLRSKGYDTSAIITTSAISVRPHAIGSRFGSGSAYPAGAQLHSTAGNEAWWNGSTARHFFNTKVRTSYQIRTIELAGPADRQVATGVGRPQLGFRDGTLIRQEGTSGVYVVSDGKRRPITSGTTFARMGYRWRNIRSVTAAEFALHPQGQPL